MIYEYNKTVNEVHISGYECHECERRFGVSIGISGKSLLHELERFLRTHKNCQDQHTLSLIKDGDAFKVIPSAQVTSR